MRKTTTRQRRANWEFCAKVVSLSPLLPRSCSSGAIYSYFHLANSTRIKQAAVVALLLSSSSSFRSIICACASAPVQRRSIAVEDAESGRSLRRFIIIFVDVATSEKIRFFCALRRCGWPGERIQTRRRLVAACPADRQPVSVFVWLLHSHNSQFDPIGLSENPRRRLFREPIERREKRTFSYASTSSSRRGARSASPASSFVCPLGAREPTKHPTGTATMQNRHQSNAHFLLSLSEAEQNEEISSLDNNHEPSAGKRLECKHWQGAPT